MLAEFFVGACVMKYVSLFFLFLSLFLVGLISPLLQGSSVVFRETLNFYEKAAEINGQLYKISAKELQDVLNCSYPNIPTITAQALQNKMNNDANLLVINVLPKNLFDDCHIVGSQSIPLKELIEVVADWPRDQEIIVYCALDICDAGQKAYVLLSCMGFSNVVDYEGGIKEWFQLGYPTSGPANSAYLHVKFAKLPEELTHELSECCGTEIPRN